MNQPLRDKLLYNFHCRDRRTSSSQYSKSFLRRNMNKYECIACGYIYDPAIGDPSAGIEPGTPFEDLPEDWVCPDCGVGKDQFEKIG